MITTWEVKGREEKTIEIAKNLLNIGMEIEKIAEVTGLKVEEVKQLAVSG